nr:MAG: HlyD family efflux transporter periplasmic adaptor subunit [Hyphomicrobiales bacterium]
MVSCNKVRSRLSNLGAVILLSVSAASCGEQSGTMANMEVDAADFERGPHNGRMLRDGDFALEITVFETGVTPEFRVYPYADNDSIDPGQIGLAMAVSRTGGQVDRFAFAPQEDFLRGQSVLFEPHSFDVSVNAQYGGASFSWTYESYEGRTTIARPVADAAGVAVEEAGPALIEETVTLQGVVELLPEGRAEIRAWYPGRIVAMHKFIGDQVKAGEIVARIEAAQSLQTYSITAPFSGFVIERDGTEGGVAGEESLYVIMDPTKLHAELFVFPQNALLVRAGQEVEIRGLVGDASFQSEVEIVLSPGEVDTPMRVAHVEIPAADERWWPGMAVEGEVVVGLEEVPLAVRTSALQRFRDFTVVYGRFGDTYEVRMLELGRQTPEWTEVLGGLQPGTTYVTENAYLIRADVEKDGAVHDH